MTALLPSQDYEVSVTTISVWIRATDRSGSPVPGLTANDFEIFEDGKKMTPSCFEVTAVQSGSEQPPEQDHGTQTSAQSSGKQIVLYLDLFNTTEAEFSNIEPRLKDFLKQIAEKKWNVMLTEVSPSGSLEVTVPFTKDIDAIQHALDSVSGSNQRDLSMRIRIKELSFILERYLETGDGNLLQAAVAQADKFSVDEQNSSEFSLDALEKFSDYVIKIQPDVHTIVLFISGGINIHPGRVYYEMINKAAGGSEGPTALGSRFGLGGPENLDVLNEIKKIIGRLNRQNLTVYGVNSRGMYTPDNTGFDQRTIVDDPSLLRDLQDSMAQIAEETGGISFQNSQNFKFGFDQIVTDLGDQYLICYNPPEHKKPGQYHKIKVTCKKKGIDLRYRKGYLDG
jgi:VWFA-related protein